VRITPMDIREQQFTVKMFRGFDVQEVDTFLEDLAEDYETLLKENQLLSEEEYMIAVDEFGVGPKLINTVFEGSGLFGDAATELCIRSDGDEGLFASYTDVQFLAPVRAGRTVTLERQAGTGWTAEETGFEGRILLSRDKAAYEACKDKVPTPDPAFEAKMSEWRACMAANGVTIPAPRDLSQPPTPPGKSAPAGCPGCGRAPTSGGGGGPSSCSACWPASAPRSRSPR